MTKGSLTILSISILGGIMTLIGLIGGIATANGNLVIIGAAGCILSYLSGARIIRRQRPDRNHED